MSDLCPPLIPSGIERIDGGCTHSLVPREPNEEKLSSTLLGPLSLSLVLLPFSLSLSLSLSDYR